MKFKALISPTLSEMFVEEIESMILSGKLATGEKLPSERELADAMRVSRAVINGGTTELASIGFLEVVPRKGIYVADYKSRGKLEVLQVILEHNGGRFDTAMLHSVLQMRLACEQDFVSLAAQQRAQADIEAITAQLARIKASREPAHFADATCDFYRLIAVASRNMVYPLLYHTMRPIYTALFEALYTLPVRQEQVELLTELAACIERQQPNEAADCACVLINRTRAAFEEQS